MYTNYINYISTIINNDIKEATFKSNENYTYVLEHVSFDQGSQYLFEIINRYNLFYNNNKELLIELCNINDLYGSPIKYTYENFTTCSPTNLRYILHSILILKYMNQCQLNDIDIIEIGGGYGGLCFFMNKLSHLFNININTYNIFDLKIVQLLQDKYLKNININNVKFPDINDLNNIKYNSFLISNYAFSEIDKNLQKEYIDKLIKKYINYGFLTWNITDFYIFLDNTIFEKEIEYPYTEGYGHNNFYIKFKPS